MKLFIVVLSTFVCIPACSMSGAREFDLGAPPAESAPDPVEPVEVGGVIESPFAPIPERPPAAADVIIDRLFDEPGATIRSGTARQRWLTLLALNDGDEGGTIDRLVFNTRAVVIPAEPDRPSRETSFREGIQACDLVQDGRVLGNGRFEGEQVIFDHTNITVTSEARGADFDNFVRFELVCDTIGFIPTLPLYSVIRIWFGMDADEGATLIEPAPAHVEGTLLLEQNVLGLDGSMGVQIL